jgi:uncharacterized protein YjiS (DUF1127 family)
MLLSLVRYLQSWRRYGLAIQELSQLNDRELSDIGITRCDIPRIAWEHAGRADSVRQALNEAPPAAALPTQH